MKKTIFALLIIVSLLMVSCELDPEELSGLLGTHQNQETQQNDVTGTGASEETNSLSTETEKFTQDCQINADCPEWEECIDGKCGTIEQLYDTNCEEKCNFQQVTVSTSDGQTLTLNRGSGDYTAAGALEWQISVVPDFCKGSVVKVPIKIIKKNYGEIVEEEIITLQKGQSSKLLTHPQISRVQFTVTLDDVVNTCS